MKKNITADTLAVVMLFAVFVLSVFSVLIYGANVYRKTAEASYFNYTERTCLSYITQKIRHYDQKDCVKTENINGIIWNILAILVTLFLIIYQYFLKNKLFL